MAEGSKFPGNVYVRGSPHNLGDPVHGRNLTALGGQSGSRLDLAQQLTSSDNPLVARVMANRIWLQFLTGIVPTPDDLALWDRNLAIQNYWIGCPQISEKTIGLSKA